jgi:hypothetical protein
MRFTTAHVITAGALLAAALSVPAHADEVTANPPPPGTAGMQAHVDPQTGQPVSEPATTELPSVSEAAARSRSSAGLVEEPAPGGGVTVHLRGRFRSPLTADVGPDGQQQIHHATTGDAGIP